MDRRITYRQVNAAEAEELVRVHRASFPPQHVARTIFGASGVAAYLESLIGLPGFSSAHRIFGAWQAGRLIGYFHGRLINDSWHLNYIAVLPERQSDGVGGTLWRAWLDHRPIRARLLSLDVEAANASVVAWYERNGFAAVETSWTYEYDLSREPESGGSETHLATEELQLRDWESAQAWQRVYGFSQFQLASEQSAWQVGRLGDNYFRASAPLPHSVIRALRRIDPHRSLLLVSRECLDFADYKPAGVSIRMVKPAEQ